MDTVTPERAPSRKNLFHFWRCFWLLLLVVSLAYAWHCFYVPPNDIAWANSYAEAKERAENADKPMVLFFTANWCVPCRVMKREVWADRQVMSSVNSGFIPAAIDVDRPENSGLLSQFEIGATPVTIITNSQGIALDWRAGGISKTEFLELLEASDNAHVPW